MSLFYFSLIDLLQQNCLMANCHAVKCLWWKCLQQRCSLWNPPGDGLMDGQGPGWAGQSTSGWWTRLLDGLWRSHSFVCSQDHVNLRLLVAIYERYISEWVWILAPPLTGWAILGRLLNPLHLSHQQNRNNGICLYCYRNTWVNIYKVLRAMPSAKGADKKYLLLLLLSLCGEIPSEN